MSVRTAGHDALSGAAKVDQNAGLARTPMDVEVARESVQEAVDDFIAAWCAGAAAPLMVLLADDVCLHSDQHGMVHGAAASSAALCADLQLADSLEIDQSNACVSGSAQAATFSSYLHGVLRTDPLFPGMVFEAAITCELHTMTTGWRIRRIRLAVASVEGRCELAPHWRCFAGNDVEASMTPPRCCARDVSLPWPHVHGAHLAGSPEERVIAAFSRLAWSLDQNDAALMSTCFRGDARVEVGGGPDVIGCYAIVQYLGRIHMAQTRHRHFADVVTLVIDDAKGTARMLIGHIVPAHRYAHDGTPIYDAYYDLTARRSWHGEWRFEACRYVAGWIDMRQLWHVSKQMGLIEA